MGPLLPERPEDNIQNQSGATSSDEEGPHEKQGLRGDIRDLREFSPQVHRWQHPHSDVRNALIQNKTIIHRRVTETDADGGGRETPGNGQSQGELPGHLLKTKIPQQILPVLISV